MPSDFGDSASLPFVAGSIFGKRVWGYNKDARRLHSPVFGFNGWRSGVIEAKCINPHTAMFTMISMRLWGTGIIPEVYGRYRGHELQGDTLKVQWYMEGAMEYLSPFIPEEDARYSVDYGDEMTMVDAAGSLMLRHTTITGVTTLRDVSEMTVVVEALEAAKNHPSHLDICTCGFYAYYGNEYNIYASGATPVAGVIEGFGETLVGTKGFRCSKTRIVALAPHSGFFERKGARERRKLSKQLRKQFPDIPVFQTATEMYKEIPVTTAEEVLGLERL